VPANKGGEKTGKNPTDRGKPGSKRHLVSDKGGVPLAVVLTAANIHDSTVFEEAVDATEPTSTKRSFTSAAHSSASTIYREGFARRTNEERGQ
jgi:Transposase DDE domain